MTKALITLVLVLATPLPSLAVESSSAPPAGQGSAADKQAAARQAEGLKRMAKDLGLNEEQKAKVATIFGSEREKVEAILKEQGEKLKAVQEETKSGLQGVLTPAQMAKLEKKMQQKGPPKQPK